MPNPIAKQQLMDYSSPWSCCTGCLPAVRARDMTRMLNRALNSRNGIASRLSTQERALFRAGLRELYSLYLRSAPAGPYELRIRPTPRPLGKRGSARGVTHSPTPRSRRPSPG